VASGEESRAGRGRSGSQWALILGLPPRAVANPHPASASPWPQLVSLLGSQ